MDTKGLVNVIKEFSPMVATVLGAASPVAGVIFECVAKLFGITTSNPDDLSRAISADPDAKTKLKEFELKHQELLLQYASQDYASEVDDRKNARDRELAYIRTGRTDWVEHTLAILIVLGFLGMCYVISLTKLDQSDHDILYMLLGILGANFGNVYGFYFGSSKKQN